VPITASPAAALPQSPAPAKPVAVPQRPKAVPTNPAVVPQGAAPVSSRPAFVLQNPGLKPAKPKQAPPKPLPLTARIDLQVAQSSGVPESIVDQSPPAIAATPLQEERPITAPEQHPATTTPELSAATPPTFVETPVAMVTAKIDEPSLAVTRQASMEHGLASILATSVSVKKSPRIIAVIAAAALLLLAIGAVFGGFVYNNSLDNQYLQLAEAAPTLPSLPLPAETTSYELQMQAAQAGKPNMTVPAGAVPEATKRENRDPQLVKNAPAPAPQPPTVNQPAKSALPASPVLPRASLSPDRVGADSRNPIGVPLEVPIGAAQPPEPPAKPFRQSPGVVMGGAIRKVDPVYPTAARSAGQSGAVQVEVLVSERGDVISARALSGPAILQNAAVSAARAWKFKASTLGGVPVKTTTTIVFNFKL